MDNIIIEWGITESGQKFISTSITDLKIEISSTNKEIKNAKSFFRDLLYISYISNWSPTITLEDNPEIEIEELKPIINDLINICNEELVSINEAEETPPNTAIPAIRGELPTISNKILKESKES